MPWLLSPAAVQEIMRLRMLHNPCRFSDVCRLYLKESSTCNSDSEAVGYCGVFRTYAES